MWSSLPAGYKLHDYKKWRLTGDLEASIAYIAYLISDVPWVSASRPCTFNKLRYLLAYFSNPKHSATSTNKAMILK